MRHQRALPAGVELLEEARKLTDDALLAVALLAAPASVAAFALQVAVMTVGEEPIPEKKEIIEYDFFNRCKIIGLGFVPLCLIWYMAEVGPNPR